MLKSNMLKTYPFVLIVFSLFISSCALESKHEIVEPDLGPISQDVSSTSTQESNTSKGIKKTITDRDLKKLQEEREHKKRVVVLPFIDRKKNLALTTVTKAQLAFMDKLNASEDLVALDSSVLKVDLNKYIKNNMYDLKALAQDVQTAGISCLLEGRIINMRFKKPDVKSTDAVETESVEVKKIPAAFEVVVQARLLNIRSEQELFNTVKTVTLEESSLELPADTNADAFFASSPELSEILVRDAFLDFNSKLMDSLKQITWEGRIAAFQGDRIFLNVGQISGVQIGDILKVVDDGNEIYDSELGYHLGKVQGKVKGTIEVVGFFGQDSAIGVIHSGAGFKENDRIEIYQ